MRTRLLLFVRCFVLLATVMLAVVLVAECVRAQAPVPKEKGAEPKENSEVPPILRVYRLKYVQAMQLVRNLQELLGISDKGEVQPGWHPLFVAYMRFAADKQTNSVIVWAQAEEQARVEALIKTLDVPVPGDESGRTELRIFFLKKLKPDADLEKALKLLSPGQPGLFALDRQRRAVIVSGDRRLVTEMEALLSKLEEAQAGQAGGSEVRVRVVWLVSGQPKDAPAIPADLREVQDELSRLGIDNLSLAAQVLVTTPLQGTFQVEGSTKLDVPCRLAIQGSLEDLIEQKRQLGLEIEIQAYREGSGAPSGNLGSPGGPPGSRSQVATSLCNLQTHITAPLGHAVVLGVTPTDGKTSVFVVQILPKEGKAEAPKAREK